MSFWNSLKNVVVPNKNHFLFGPMLGMGVNAANEITGSGGRQMNNTNYEQPGMPGFQNIWDESQSLYPFMEQQTSGINLNRDGLNKLRSEALRTGPSQWANLREQSQRLDQKNAMEGMKQDTASELATQRAQLAMRGGLSGGARERLAQSAIPASIQMQQGQRQQGQMARLGIGIQDEQNRMNQLQSLPGLELSALQPDLEKAKLLTGAKEFDTQARAKNTTARNQYEMDKYNQQMQAWASNRTAQATENSGKK